MTDGQKQLLILKKTKEKCNEKIRQYVEEPQADEISKCPMVWDDLLCWDAAPAGTMQKQRCPEYVENMNHSAYAYRYCEPHGEWFHHRALNKSWTNYIGCVRGNVTLPHDAFVHKDQLRLIQSIGYGLSLVSLVIAVVIMCFLRLKSKSNTLHVNLFLAFILRAVSSFLKEFLFVSHLGLEKDVNRTEDGKISFIEEGPHWECRLLYTVFIYSICASQMWIFVEGLYLHMLIYRTLSTERNGVRPYIVLGWVLPLIILIPWIVVKAVHDNILCWNLGSKGGYIWIHEGPLIATVVVNCFFFLNISRVLCSRARSSRRHAGQAKYRQLAKFVLVLIPLFGVVFIVFAVILAIFPDRFDYRSILIEQIYNAFQGFILALLFCFLNEEVQNEMKRLWWRRKTRRRDSALTRSFMLSSFRRGNSYTAARATSNKAIHPVRTPSCVGNTDNSSNNPRKEQSSWPTRLKRRVLQFMGRSHCKNDSDVKSFSDSPPFMVDGESGLTGLTRAEQEEVETRMNLTCSSHQNPDLEDISG